jgi:hypothetical protein
MNTHTTKSERWPEIVRVRVSPQMLEQARRVAAEREQTVSGLARQAIMRFLAQERQP